jgi:hypothetical protein
MLPGITGFVVRENTAQALAQELIVALSNPDRLTAMRPEAYAFAQRRFNRENMANAYIEFFQAQTATADALDFNSALGQSLVQNQIGSLAAASKTIMFYQQQQTEARLQQTEARLIQAEARLQNLRHPLRWLLEKFFLQ